MAPPQPAIIGGRPSSPSDNRSRRHCPGHSGATRASPSPLSSPGTPSPPRESIPMLDFDRDSLREKNHFARRPPSAAKLTAGSSVHPRDHINHRSNRLDPLSTRMASILRTVPSFAGEPRRSSASVSAGGGDARVDWSNLTSGPGGSTVSDPVSIHAGISGNVFLEYAFDVVSPNRFSFSVLFSFKNRF